MPIRTFGRRSPRLPGSRRKRDPQLLTEGQRCGRISAGKIKRAATLVMLQLPAPAREPTTWMHSPSQPLMQSPLSRSLTPATPRRACRFFRVLAPDGLPRLANHPAYFGLATLCVSQPFRPSTRVTINSRELSVNARFWCKSDFVFLHQAVCIDAKYQRKYW